MHVSARQTAEDQTGQMLLSGKAGEPIVANSFVEYDTTSARWYYLKQIPFYDAATGTLYCHYDATTQTYTEPYTKRAGKALHSAGEQQPLRIVSIALDTYFHDRASAGGV